MKLVNSDNVDTILDLLLHSLDGNGLIIHMIVSDKILTALKEDAWVLGLELIPIPGSSEAFEVHQLGESLIPRVLLPIRMHLFNIYPMPFTG